MNLVRPKCRTRLSAEDFVFIQSVLLEAAQDEIALKSLLLDPEMLDAILDQSELYEAIQDRALTVNISAQLYFYVLVRQTLLNADIDDREMSDYIASLLISFSREDHQKKLFPELKEPMHYLIDIVTQIEKSDYYHRFFLYAHLGNQTLFLSGLFPNHIRHREQRRAAPGLRYYESMGRSHFKAARNHPLAKEFAMQELYDDLYQSFYETRQALNGLADKLY
ncbi:hypothetical protein F7C95_16005 [Opitutia bacterium ISCC 51]|nr:hypothetical protein F7C95_16005 [Opitutae bacterium ISCC 51]QXD27486.1 hypothetical protein GA003_15905 [Opitutae bacterium ISCC 52]